ncbi:MAG: hypothetical protein IPJ68_01370 [Candidatus Moraniibacteriota bacterium]|nr:MAG: hypothetical protein IPJ68_01370 [Candidatus Moranbacteria bacterium]
MWVKTSGVSAVEIDDDVFRTILSFYPEEKLHESEFFQSCFSHGSVSYTLLRAESNKIFLPWQLFFLNKKNLKKQLKHINEQREDRLSAAFFTKRKGSGEHMSRRIVDRLIRLQGFVVSKKKYQKNSFCNSLNSLSPTDAANSLIEYFGVDLVEFRGKKTKREALEYLIKKIGAGQINVSRGVRVLLPIYQQIDKIYKNTSGFALKDDCLPFIFLPGDINPEEATGRQIYSLFYLLASIGINDYSFFIDQDLEVQVVGAKNLEKWKHDLVSCIILPTDSLTTIPTSLDDIMKMSDKYKVTPTAVIVVLRARGIINSALFDFLKSELNLSVKTFQQGWSAKISTSVKKFCGQEASAAINMLIRGGKLKSITAQYLIFGRVNKSQYKKYFSQIQNTV